MIKCQKDRIQWVINLSNFHWNHFEGEFGYIVFLSIMILSLNFLQDCLVVKVTISLKQ